MPIKVITNDDLLEISRMLREYTDMLPDDEPNNSRMVIDLPEIGYITYNDVGAIAFITAKRLTDYYFIQNLYVRPGWRGLGLGTTLLSQIPTDMNCFLKVRIDHQISKEAIKFYEFNGFTRVRMLDEKRLLMSRAKK